MKNQTKSLNIMTNWNSDFLFQKNKMKIQRIHKNII